MTGVFLKPREPGDRWIIGGLVCLGIWVLIGATASGLTLGELRREPNLTPQKFARFFSDFKYQYHAEVQEPEVFLSSESGDCDDYGVVAARVLQERGYHTRLVAVRMPGVTHVVCYVEETKCYLDYNNRIYLIKTTSADGTLRDIARKVSKSFDASWTSASEFVYTNGVKLLVATVSQTDKYSAAPVIAGQPARRIVIDF
jgi:hypothetical protein